MVNAEEKFRGFGKKYPGRLKWNDWARHKNGARYLQSIKKINNAEENLQLDLPEELKYYILHCLLQSGGRFGCVAIKLNSKRNP